MPAPGPLRARLTRVATAVVAAAAAAAAALHASAAAPVPAPAAGTASATGNATAGERFVFNRDIKPILSDNCYACHGPDPGSRKAGLRLDTRDGLFTPTDRRAATVLPGKPEESELYRRLVTHDAEDLMPPPDSRKRLEPAQKETLRRWIAAGAPWQPHWAFVKPERPPVPAPARPAFPIRNPVDAFVLARLDAEGLTPAPEADRRTLARRLALDLTGLPPTPEAVERFVADPAPDAYERYVQGLMDSPAWGEHRARYWLDAARYADTHGLHFDNYREMWPYRDWVIQAFNRNLPFDRFTLEQLAGDLLPEPTDDQLIATGFHRCNATTNEGGTIEEENKVNYANDRVTTTGWVWLGLTANCAACHDHKFDPLTMRDFYSLAAFFRNTTQSGFDGNVKDGANAAMTVVDDPADRARWTALPGLVEAAKNDLRQRRESSGPAFDAWASTLTVERIDQDLQADLLLRAPLDTPTNTPPTARREGRDVPVRLEPPLRREATGHSGPAIHFEKDGALELGDAGDFDLPGAFTVAAWVFVPTNVTETAALVARMDESARHRGWDVWYQGGQFATHVVHDWPDDALKVRTRKRLARKGEWQHVAVTFDGSGRAEGVRIYVDGAAAETEPDGPSRVRNTIRTSTPLRLGRRSSGASFTGGALQDVRLYRRVLAAPEVRSIARLEEMRRLLATPRSEWKPEAREELLDLFLLRDGGFQGARRHLARLENERDTLRARYPVTHIQKEKPDSQPMAAVLFRGQYDQPRDQVPAATPAALHPFPAGAPTNRLGLARWLLSPDNPLTARVTVNRFWQEVFGIGLVRTTEDFGIVGEPPSNPDLLDWLATEFVASGWDVKHLFRLLVTSSAYRQSAATSPEKLEKDPANRLLSRGSRHRLDAEVLRDSALAAAGLLDSRVGGPSVKPYQPDGVWEAVAMPESNTRRYQRDAGAALYRRSVYTFWKRSAPPALLDVFNAPSRETCTVRRERTNTPLQALATLNGPEFVEAARTLAEHALIHSRFQSEAALDELALRILARPLAPGERQEVRSTLDDLRQHYATDPAGASALLAVGESRTSLPPSPEFAALTLVANQLLNLDESLSK